MRRKVCNACGIAKPATLKFFVHHKHCRGGIGPYCRPCRNDYSQRWKSKNKERLSHRTAELYRIQKGPAILARRRQRTLDAPLLVAARNLRMGLSVRSRVRGLELDSRLRKTSFILAWLKRQPACECCSEQFFFGPKNGMAHDLSPSFDQIVPGAGYTLKNTALICWRCNNIKRNYGPSDLRMVADWVERRR